MNAFNPNAPPAAPVENLQALPGWRYICSHCHRICVADPAEVSGELPTTYLPARLSLSLCPECLAELHPGVAVILQRKAKHAA